MTAELPPILLLNITFIFKYKTNYLLCSIHSKNQDASISSIFTLVFLAYGSNYSYIFKCVALWGFAVCWWFVRYCPGILFTSLSFSNLNTLPPFPFNRDMYSVYHVFILKWQAFNKLILSRTI